MLKTGHSKTNIANAIRVHWSTKGLELQRNHGQRGYRSKQAHQMALQRRNKAKARIQEDTWALIEINLR